MRTTKESCKNILDKKRVPKMRKPMLTDEVLGSLPNTIVVETTNFCNLRCPVCFTHSRMTRKRGMMEMRTFTNIIDSLSEFQDRFLPSLAFTMAGEPTLHKGIADFVRLATRNGVETSISTNATVLDESLSKDLLEGGLSSILLCLDGITKEAHEAYRIGSDFNKVKENIEHFVALRDRLQRGKKRTHCTLLTLLTKYSENQIEQITSWAAALGFDQIHFKTLGLGSQISENERKRFRYLLPQNAEYRRHVSGKVPISCDTPLNQIVIWWNGDISPCCVDYNSSVIYGNINERPLKDILYDTETVSKRKRAWEKSLAICGSCQLNSADSMGWKVRIGNKR